MSSPTVEITQTGRGGSIYYNEGVRTVAFEWEFAASPALALICGPTAEVWDRNFPWAAGRQAEIYSLVGVEVVRQKAPRHRFHVDLESGTITIVPEPSQLPSADPPVKTRVPRPPRDKHTRAYKRFMASVPAIHENWRDDQTYDGAAIGKMSPEERKKVCDLLTGRDITWREVVALAAIPTPEARAAVDEALKHHLSIDARLAAAEAMHQQGRMADLETFLARQIRQLYEPSNGLRRALLMAERHPSETIKQALLWASWNQTECAPECAKLLLKLTGAAPEPFAADVQQMLEKLGLHNSYFDRRAAFDNLCRRVGMELDTSAAE
jgi:hypothetical protein